MKKGIKEANYHIEILPKNLNFKKNINIINFTGFSLNTPYTFYLYVIKNQKVKMLAFGGGEIFGPNLKKTKNPLLDINYV